MAAKQKGKGLSHLGVEMCNLFCWVNNFQRNVTTNYELIFNGYEGKGNLLISRLQEGVGSLQYLRDHLSGYSKILFDMAKSIEGMSTTKQLEGVAVDTQQQSLADFYGSSLSEVAALTAAGEAFKTQFQTLEQLQQELNENIKELTKKLNSALQKGKKDWKLVLSTHKEMCKVIEPSLSRLQKWAAGRGNLDDCVDSGDPALLQFKYKNSLAIFFESLDSIGQSIKEIFTATKELDIKKVETIHTVILFASQQKSTIFGDVAKGNALETKYANLVNGETCWGEFCHNSDLLKDCMKDCGGGGEKTTNTMKKGGGKVGLKEFEEALPPLIKNIIPLSSTNEQKTPAQIGARLKNGEPQSIAFVIDVESKAMIGWDKYCLVLSHFGFLHLYQAKKGKEWVDDSPEVTYPASILSTEFKKDKLSMKCKPKSALSFEKNYTFRSKGQNMQKFIDYLNDYSAPTMELLPFSFSSSAPEITPYPVSDPSSSFSSSQPTFSSSSSFSGSSPNSVRGAPGPSPRGNAPPPPGPSPRANAPPPPLPSRPSP